MRSLTLGTCRRWWALAAGVSRRVAGSDFLALVPHSSPLFGVRINVHTSLCGEGKCTAALRRDKSIRERTQRAHRGIAEKSDTCAQRKRVLHRMWKSALACAVDNWLRGTRWARACTAHRRHVSARRGGVATPRPRSSLAAAQSANERDSPETHAKSRFAIDAMRRLVAIVDGKHHR